MKVLNRKKRSETIEVSDTYEAAFYLLFGAKYINVRTRVVRLQQSKREGYANQWYITLSDVPCWAIETWQTGNAYGNITEFVNVRTKLKGKIKRELGIIS